MVAEYAQPTPVATVYPGNKEYFMIGFDRPNRVKVTPTELGKRALDGRLWPAWLRSMLLGTADPKFSYGVEINGKHVLVSSSGSAQELFSTVFSLAARIRPLNNILQEIEYYTSSTLAVWNIRQGRRYYPVDMLKDSIALPSKTELITIPSRYNAPDQLWLYRERSCSRTMHDLRVAVELELALLVDPMRSR